MKEKVFVINRFPIAATFYAAIARKIGYSEEEAYSFGLHRSIFMAAAKNGFRSGASKKRKYYPGKMSEKVTSIVNIPENMDQINFAGLGMNVVSLPNGEYRGIIGGEILTAEKFKRDIIEKFNRRIHPGAFEQCWNKINEIIKDFSDTELNSGTAYKLYQQYRDELRKPEVYSD